MRSDAVTVPLPSVPRTVRSLASASRELLGQEFRASTGHLATLLNGCVFAPSLFTFWLVNGVVDFSTATIIGSIGTPGGLAVRLLAYLLLVPVFLLLRASYYLLHPTHRRAVLAGTCPNSEVLSLDWFSVGILATGLPLAFQDLGPWLGMNLVFVLGVFVMPRFLAAERRDPLRLAAIGLGIGLFLYANYGGVLAALGLSPAPSEVVGPIATLRLSDGTVSLLLGVTNALLTGPVVVAAVALTMNWVLTRDELNSLPVIRHSLPRYDPPGLVVASAALGTVFYLLVVALYTGRLVVAP